MLHCGALPLSGSLPALTTWQICNLCLQTYSMTGPLELLLKNKGQQDINAAWLRHLNAREKEICGNPQDWISPTPYSVLLGKQMNAEDSTLGDLAAWADVWEIREENLNLNSHWRRPLIGSISGPVMTQFPFFIFATKSHIYLDRATHNWHYYKAKQLYKNEDPGPQWVGSRNFPRAGRTPRGAKAQKGVHPPWVNTK